MKTVALIGHKDFYSDSSSVSCRLTYAVEKLIKDGADTFLLNQYSKFDIYCNIIMRDLKDKHQHIKLILVPVKPRTTYSQKLFDGMINFPFDPAVPPADNIFDRNKFVVDNADALIAYVETPFSGTGRIVEYAKGLGKQVIEI